MHLSGKVVVALLLLALPSFAADLAILQNGFSIRHERREVRGFVTRLFLDSDNGSFVDIPSDQIERFERDLTPSIQSNKPTTSQDVAAVVKNVSSRHHLDPDLVNSVIHAESRFNTHAVSAKGAQGLMQLMPATSTQLGVSNPFDPGDNVEGGTRYLRELLEKYNFDLIKALAAYNAGPQRVEQYKGVPPYHETRAYVAGIIRDFNRKKDAEQKAATAAKPVKKAAPTTTQKAKPAPVVPPAQ